MEIVQISARRRFDNSGPVFAAFKEKLIDLSASPVAMRIGRLDNGDIIGPVWPIRYITTCFFILLHTVSYVLYLICIHNILRNSISMNMNNHLRYKNSCCSSLFLFFFVISSYPNFTILILSSKFGLIISHCRRSCFMFRTISSTKIKPGQFLKPLSVKVWYVILAMIGIVTTILVILLRLEGVQTSTEIYGLSVLLTIGALSQQGISRKN